MPTVLGLDIGGANLKAAHSNGDCESQPFALWREPARLAEHLDALLAVMPHAQRLAITMTGELCDCFETKRQGVYHILDAVEAVTGPRQVRVWSTAGAFLTIDAARKNHMQVAAANWHAQATWIARRFAPEHGVLIDTGSTTTDIIPFGNGRVLAKGLTDTQRLASNELIYVGGLRTPVMAMASSVSFRGERRTLMAEFFADSGDVRQLLGHLPPEYADHQTADGRARSVRFAAARLLRMVGADLDHATEQDAIDMARQLYDWTVCQSIRPGLIEAHRVAFGQPTGNTPVSRSALHVLSGSAPDMPMAAIESIGPASNLRIHNLAGVLTPAAAGAACAVALTELGQGDLWHG